MKSCSGCLPLWSRCSLSSCSWRSGGSCLMIRPRINPVSAQDEVDDDDEVSPWCSRSSSSVSSGWLWCCLPGTEAPDPAADTWSPGLDIIWRKRRQQRWDLNVIFTLKGPSTKTVHLERNHSHHQQWLTTKQIFFFFYKTFWKSGSLKEWCKPFHVI